MVEIFALPEIGDPEKSASLPQLLRRYPQGAIKFTRRVFPGDRGRQFHQSVLSEKSAQALEEFITDVASRNCHSVGELKRNAFCLSIEVTVRVVRQGVNLGVRNSELAAHGSIYVLSKLATVEKCNTPVDQRSQTRVY